MVSSLPVKFMLPQSSSDDLVRVSQCARNCLRHARSEHVFEKVFQFWFFTVLLADATHAVYLCLDTFVDHQMYDGFRNANIRGRKTAIKSTNPVLPVNVFDAIRDPESVDHAAIMQKPRNYFCGYHGNTKMCLFWRAWNFW